MKHEQGIKMNNKTLNNWLANESEEGKRQIDHYLSFKNIILVERERTTKLLFDVLRKCGFRNVDCFYKYGIFAMFGGTK